jgi:streptomycin 6-kinase
MIKPLAIDERLNAILLPFIKLGVPLYAFADDEKQTQIAADLIMNMPVSSAKDYKFPLLTDWFRKISEFPDENKSLIPSKHLVDAAHIFGELQKEEFSPCLMHGDLHHHNILQSSDSWIVIDPKGVIGNPLYETACFLYNPSPKILRQNAEKILGKRIEIFADILPYQPEEIAAMAYCQSVLSSVWCIEDRQNCWQNAISFAEIFKRIL